MAAADSQLKLPDLTIHDTLPKLLRLNAREHPDGTALREKDFGIWRSISWAAYHARTRDFALGLKKLGVERGEVVALIGDNRPDWVMGEIAAHAVGAMSLGIYRDALDDEVAYLITFAGVHVVFAEDEEQDGQRCKGRPEGEASHGRGREGEGRRTERAVRGRKEGGEKTAPLTAG